ncbi:MAG: hypothetical protein ACXWQA_07000 [Pseudobdellovibrionaceae bacterium]
MTETNKKDAPPGYITISEGIRLSGVARSTFYEHIKDGKISVSTLNFKGKEKKFLQVVDVLNVFGSVSENKQKTEQVEQQKTDFLSAVELAKAQVKIEGLETLIRELRQAKETAERDKEKFADLLAESMNTVKLLGAPTPAQVEKKRGLFARLFRKG